MSKSDKFLKGILQLIEAGMLSSENIKKELDTYLKFQRDHIINKLDLVTREEFEIQKAIISKLQKKLNQTNKKKIRKKLRR